MVLRSVQSRVRQRDPRLCELVADRDPQSSAQFRVTRCIRSRRGTVWVAIAERFLPEEDQGYVYLALQLPDAASLERTDQAAHKIEDILSKIPGVQYTTSVVGFSLLSLVQNTYSAFFFVTFKPWSERTKPEEQYTAIKANINKQLCRSHGRSCFCFSAAGDSGRGHLRRISVHLGRSLRQRRRLSRAKCEDVSRRRAQTAGTGTLIPTFLPNVPQVFVKVDRDKVLKQGIDLGQVYQTLQTFMGGFFVNYFNRFGRTGRYT